MYICIHIHMCIMCRPGSMFKVRCMQPPPRQPQCSHARVGGGSRPWPRILGRWGRGDKVSVLEDLKQQGWGP